MKKWICGLIGCLIFTATQAQDLSQLKKEPAFRWTGALHLQQNVYAASGDVPFRSDAYSWSITGNPTAYLYGFELPFSFTLGRQIRDVRYPVFNQFGVSPTWKWLKLHAGWRNMTFSPYTLAGHTFLGGGVEMTPGLFRFSAMYGRFHRAASTNAGQEYFLPTYKRMGYGVKIGIGTATNYFDVMAFKAKDRPDSVVLPDSLGITPGENLVLGVSGKATLWKRVSFSVDGAASAYTRNLHSEPVATDSLNGGEYYGLEGLYTPRFSTRFNFAGKATAAYFDRHFGLQLAYEHIDPEYATMGAYFFNNDVENYTVSPNFNLVKGKLRLSGSYGVQRNNLLGNREQTSWRNIGAANININPSPKFGVDFNYSNYRMSQTSTAFEFSDSLKLAQSTTQFSCTPRFSVIKSNLVQTWIVNGMYQFLDDQNPLSSQYGDVRVRSGMLTWVGAFVQSKISLQSTLNYNGVVLGDTRTSNYGLSAGIGSTFAKDRLNMNINGTYNLARLNEKADGAILNGSLSGSWQFHAKHALNFGVYYLQSSSSYRGKYAEWRGSLGYSWQFK